MSRLEGFRLKKKEKEGLVEIDGISRGEHTTTRRGSRQTISATAWSGPQATVRPVYCITSI